jgi:replication factor A1
MDDLCSWEEFERLVESKAGAAGDDDERSAALEVVSDAGRLHTPLAALMAGPSLVSFFCRVIEIKEVERFDRPEGGDGFVSRILCGDETGEVLLTLWDEKAFAAREISGGEILEVVGRLKRRGNVDVADLRKPEKPPKIILRRNGMRTFSPVSIDCVILAFAGGGTFQAPGGRESVYIRLITGDCFGEAEVMFWNKASLEDFQTGDYVRISGIYERPSSGSKRSYSADEKCLLTSLKAEEEKVVHEFSSLISVTEDGWSGSISVNIDDPGELREFVTRRGMPSHVRNLQVSDESGTAVLVMWGKQACLPFVKGDRADIFFSEARERETKQGSAEIASFLEIHAGYSSFVSLAEGGGKSVSIRGIITPRNGYFSIDNRESCYPLKDLKDGMLPCMEAVICGTLYESGRLEVNNFEMCREDMDLLESGLEEVKRRAGC